MKVVSRILFFLFLLALGKTYSQSKKDSLLKIYGAKPACSVPCEADTNRLKTLNELAILYKNSARYDSALLFTRQAKELSGELLNITTLNASQKYALKKQLGNSWNNEGNIYNNSGNYPEALSAHFAALKIREEIKNQKGIAASHNNIGIVYFNQKDYAAALKSHFAALKIREVADKPAVAVSFLNIGNNYLEMGKIAADKKDTASNGFYNKAIFYFEKTLDEGKKQDNIQLLANTYGNMGNVYNDQKNYPKALETYLQANELFQEMGDEKSIAACYLNLGDIYASLGKMQESVKYYTQSIELAKKNGDRNEISGACFGLSLTYEKTGDHRRAFDYYKLHIAYRDSLLNEENTKKTVQAEMNYEFDKKESATKLEQEKKEAVSIAESKKQKIIIWSVCGILLLVIGFAVFVYRSYLQKQKINIEITKQKHLIEEKQKEILDSIYYARRIQRSLLTNEIYISRNLKKLQKN